MTTRRLIQALAAVTVVGLVAITAAGCGGGDDGGNGGGVITADGSSTVGPFVTTAAADFKDEAGVDVTVGISGTGGGFERFCAGETDISNASQADRRGRGRPLRGGGRSSTSSFASPPTR